MYIQTTDVGDETFRNNVCIERSHVKETIESMPFDETFCNKFDTERTDVTVCNIIKGSVETCVIILMIYAAYLIDRIRLVLCAMLPWSAIIII